ncbi:MAG: DNA-binding transcriptional regulator [Pirellulales bacterium]|nr:DNA-binding transcriptional regulator [Pirellulales bacterium]
MAKRLKIAILMRSSRRCHRDLLCGIAAYARPHGPWEFYHQEEPLSDEVPGWLRNWDGDGIIIRIENRRLFEDVRKLGIPCIDLCGLFIDGGFPSIDSDYASVSRLATEHFIEHGFENFAFYGVPDIHYSNNCCRSFTEQIRQSGREVEIFQCPWELQRVMANTSEIRGLLRENEMAAWLKALPKPVGLMACNDFRAQQVLDLCLQEGIVVPDEVAVVGIGNDEVLCELSNPPMTSIDVNAWKMGYDAAALLESIIRGENPPSQRVLVEPRGIVVRQSSSVLAISDRSVAEAVRFIREHACEGIGVEEVLKKVHVSRSTLYRRFNEFLGHSPNTEIRRARLQRIKQFLSETDYPLVKIAQLVGIAHVENMCNLFKAETGMTARQYRIEARNGTRI